MRRLIVFIFTMFFIVGSSAATGSSARNTFLVLSYHDIPKEVYLDKYAVDQASFVQQIEYLRTHGYHFISLEDVIKGDIPDKAVLLTFDDAYLSFYEFVYPTLKLYGYPGVLAVVTNWIDNPPPDIKAPFMSWEQLNEIAKSNLVEIASHTQNLHRGVLYNPQGNKSWAVVSRVYNLKTETYETEDDYRQRIHDDFLLSRNILRKKLGVDVRAIVWPYGKYNQICIEEAKRVGFEMMFTIEDKWARADSLNVIPRCMVMKNPPIEEFIKDLKRSFSKPIQHRIMQADLDLIYDPDPVRQEKNLDRFIERTFNLKVSAVYLQAFCDEDGDGNVCSVYFPNRVLPMRADLFSRVVHQLSIREIEVYAWMPMLSIVLPNEDENKSLRVKEFRNGEKRLSSSWYQRLSPFSPEARRKLVMLYEDMAINARIAGVVFQDDGYLNDFEDFHPAACEEYRKISGNDNIPYQELSPEQKRRWTRLKTKTLIELSEKLKKAVFRYRPDALFVRTLYAPVLMEPESEEWFAQNYADSLKAYDYVMIMAYPKMEKVKHPVRWLKKLVQEAKKYRSGLQKTIFKVQTYDWDKERWINTKTVDKWLRVLVASDSWHVGYYPDNYTENKPDGSIIRMMMSVEDFPFKRR